MRTYTCNFGLKTFDSMNNTEADSFYEYTTGMLKRMYIRKWTLNRLKNKLLGGELNPGLLCDRQGYSPLYYQGPVISINYHTN